MMPAGSLTPVRSTSEPPRYATGVVRFAQRMRALSRYPAPPPGLVVVPRPTATVTQRQPKPSHQDACSYAVTLAVDGHRLAVVVVHHA